MKALIFGAGGQDGPYLIEQFQDQGIQAIGLPRATDVASLGDVEAAVRAHVPDYLFHLAARSTTRHEALFENHAAISTGTLNVLESVRRHAPGARVFITGSGVQFQNTGAPIDEETPFEAGSAYAVARIQSVYAARYYRALGVRAYVGYLFHHESPRRTSRHVSHTIAAAARRIAAGSAEKLELGDVSVVKEWTFAGDTTRAMLALVRQDDVFEAVIGSGEGHSIEEWLDRCFRLVGRSWRDHVTLMAGFRPEYTRLVSRPARIMSLGWKPAVGFDHLAAMMMQG